MINKKYLHKEHYYKLLGKAIVSFNDMEKTVIHEICLLLAIDGKLIIEIQGILSYLPFEGKIQIMKSLVHKKIPEHYRLFMKILKKLKEIEERRNDYIHSQWLLGTYDEDEGDLLKINEKKIFKSNHPEILIENMFVSKKDLQLFIQDINTLRDELRKFSEKLPRTKAPLTLIPN